MVLVVIAEVVAAQQRSELRELTAARAVPVVERLRQRARLKPWRDWVTTAGEVVELLEDAVEVADVAVHGMVRRARQLLRDRPLPLRPADLEA